MATLPRPGVEISQEIIVESPTVLTPSLVPCLIGPCYQIVKPLTDEGSLNSEAQVSVAAVLSSNSALGESISLSGKKMILNINGTGEQIIQFPETRDNRDLSQALVENTINLQLSGAIAEFRENKLVIRTSAKGPTASISVIDVAADSAYGPAAEDYLAMNSMVGTTVSGKTSYDNRAYTIPFSSFPSPKTDVSEIVIDKDDVDITIYYDRTATELSESSAIAMNSYHTKPTKIGNASASSAHQPALAVGTGSGRASLFGKQVVGSRTNTLVHPGSEASLLLPLCHAVAPNGAPEKLWPDVTGSSALEVTCIGKTAFFATGDADQMGLIDGAEGNEISVVIASNGQAGSCTASYGAKTLTITGSTTTTFAAVVAALSDETLAGAMSGIISIDLSVPEDTTKVCDFSDFEGTYHLGGGSDPADFSADAGDDDDGNDLSKAWACGAVSVNGAKPEDLGIAGETLLIGIDGADAIEVSLDAGTAITELINTALGTAGSAAEVSITNALGETINNVLQLSTASTNGADSTLSINASSSKVLEALFSGKTIKSESVAASGVFDANIAAEQQDRAFVIESGTDFNTQASSVMMKALQNSSVTLEVAGLRALAGIVVDTGVNGSLGNNDNETLTISNNGVPAGISLDTNDDPNQDITITVGKVNTAIGLDNGLAGIKATRLGDSTTSFLLYHTGDVGSTIALNVGLTGAGLAALLGPDVFDTTVTTESVTVTVSDSGSGSSLEISSVSNGMAHMLTSEATGAALSTTGYGLDLTESSISYSTGKISISFQHDQESVGAGGAATFQVLDGGTSISKLDYYRVWANNTQSGAPSYQARVFQGTSDRLAVSDTLHNDGQILGRIVGISSLGAGASTYNGASLIISEYAVDNATYIDDWFVRAQNLVSGDGRIDAEVIASNVDQTIIIKQGLLRTKAGLPISNDSAPVYVGYQALRKDVSPDTANPNLMVFNSISEVDTFIGPIVPVNTLAFGLYLAFLNTSNINISAIGVSEVSADAPNGTLAGYAEALDFLELKEVYALAPLTDDLNVFQKFSQHVTDMSASTAKKERMAICCPSLPTEETPVLASSGNFKMRALGGGKYEVFLHIQSEIDQNTIHLALNGNTDANGETISANDGTTFTPDQGIYLDRAGDANYYLVTSVTASSVIIETGDVFHPGLSGPGTGGNGDSFYTSGSDALSAIADFDSINGEQCSIFVRQAALDTRSTGGRLKICEGLAEIAGGVTGFQNRRLILVQPETVGVDINGLETEVPGHYLCGAIAAMIGQQAPAQPFTNLPMVGFTRPVGSNDKFSENQMSTAAAGGIYWVIQDVAGGALASRHQLTTDVTALKTRELSILKSIDFVAKIIRNQIKSFIGRRNITRQLLETVSLGIGGALSAVSGSVVAAASLDTIAQDPANPDSIILDVSLTPYYPANKIKVTIYV